MMQKGLILTFPIYVSKIGKGVLKRVLMFKI